VPVPCRALTRRARMPRSEKQRLLAVTRPSERAVGPCAPAADRAQPSATGRRQAARRAEGVSEGRKAAVRSSVVTGSKARRAWASERCIDAWQEFIV